MKNITAIPSARVPVIDLNTGLMTPQWYRFLQNIYAITRDINNPELTLPIYANNAAAIAGGLVAGQLYQVNPAVNPQPVYTVH
jgi:hypothetical protein